MSDCGNCEHCQGHGDAYIEFEPDFIDAKEQWVEEEIGEINFTLGRVTKPVEGYERLVGEIDFPKIQGNITVIVGDEYTEEEVQEISYMLARVFRAFYVRTRLYSMLTGEGATA